MDILTIKAELFERKGELKSRLERTHRHIYEKDEPVSANYNEQVKQTENDELVMILELDAIEEIARINEALNRIEEGIYKLCAVCGKHIAEDRLAAIPCTTRCIDCAE
jgi:RNA polymerase-binding transcription factor DksA